jgi:hypothetical protein
MPVTLNVQLSWYVDGLAGKQLKLPIVPLLTVKSPALTLEARMLSEKLRLTGMGELFVAAPAVLVMLIVGITPSYATLNCVAAMLSLPVATLCAVFAARSTVIAVFAVGVIVNT